MNKGDQLLVDAFFEAEALDYPEHMRAELPKLKTKIVNFIELMCNGYVTLQSICRAGADTRAVVVDALKPLEKCGPEMINEKVLILFGPDSDTAAAYRVKMETRGGNHILSWHKESRIGQPRT